MAHFEQNSVFDLSLLGRPEPAPLPEDEVILLFNQLRDPLLRYTVSLGVGVADGEDLIQDVFISLFRHLQLGRSRSNLRGWLFRVAHNQALKHRGRALRLPLFPTDAPEVHASPDANPEERFVRGQRNRRLLSVVESMPEADRNCLLLRAEGLRYREIADALGMSLGAVSKSIARSFEKLNRADRR
jgi:RNA polymerase sigma-70 factor (ECF subfamily)